jgi:hypothetical protein
MLIVASLLVRSFSLNLFFFFGLVLVSLFFVVFFEASHELLIFFLFFIIFIIVKFIIRVSFCFNDFEFFCNGLSSGFTFHWLGFSVVSNKNVLGGMKRFSFLHFQPACISLVNVVSRDIDESSLHVVPNNEEQDDGTNEEFLS